MLALRKLATSGRTLCVRSMVSESKTPYRAPPFEPERPKQVLVRNTIIGGFVVLFAWILLKPWDGQSIIDIPGASDSQVAGGKAEESSAK
jgi:hypothetical protein